MNNEKPILIDTNIFYYWSGLTTSDIKKDKLEGKFKNTQIYLSELSIFELITHYSDNKETIRRAFQFILDNSIIILPINNTNYSIPLRRNLIALIDNQDYYNGLIQSTLKEKIDIEKNILFFMIESIVGVMGLFLYNKSGGLGAEDKNNKFIIQLEAIILSNRNYLKSETAYILYKYYSNSDNKKFKKSIESLIISLLYVVSINHNLSEHNFTLLDISPDNENRLTDEEQENIIQRFKEDTTRKKIQKIIHGQDIRKIISEKYFWTTLESVLTDYESEMDQSLAPGITRYYSNLISKILLEGRILEKNDIIDSLLMKGYGNYQLITADNKFLRIIEKIDTNYFNRIELFIKECR